jgi:hypothetical protein
VDPVGGAQLEGTEWVFEDKDYSLGTGMTALSRTGRPVRVRVVRNKSGGVLLPKRAVKPGTANRAAYAGQVSGYAATVGTDVVAGVVDEFLPAAGVVDGDLFYIVVEGPGMVTTAGAGTTTLTPGLFCIPSTNGTVVAQDTTVAAGAATFNQLQGAVGRAMENVAAINTDFLCDVKCR